MGEQVDQQVLRVKKHAVPKERTGIVHVYTGDGKGKTTAALGLVVRAAGYDLKACMVQFVKGSWYYGEMDGAKFLPNFELIPLGRGFVGILDDKLPREEHVKAAGHALGVARKRMQDRDLHILILDEVNVAMSLGLLPVGDVLALMEARPKHLTLVLTGRNAPHEVLDKADLVTEMRLVKHYFDKGIPAVLGVEY